jgi:hypothetical protein
MSELELGTQVIYVPLHAEGNADHADCETGFVTSVRGSNVFCRYWSKYTPGDLRTKSGSECTLVDMLIVRDTVSPMEVLAAIERWVPRME